MAYLCKKSDLPFLIDADVFILLSYDDNYIVEVFTGRLYEKLKSKVFLH